MAGSRSSPAQEQPISDPGVWLCPGLGLAIPNSKRRSTGIPWELMGAGEEEELGWAQIWWALCRSWAQQG